MWHGGLNEVIMKIRRLIFPTIASERISLLKKIQIRLSKFAIFVSVIMDENSLRVKRITHRIQYFIRISKNKVHTLQST